MYDIIIIGGGPAGMTAALYAQRNGKTALVIEKNAFGGQIVNSPLVENIPGSKSITGSEFAEKFLDQILDHVIIEVLVEILAVRVGADVHDDVGTEGLLLALLDRVTVRTLALPFPCLVLAVLFGPYGDIVGYEE